MTANCDGSSAISMSMLSTGEVTALPNFVKGCHRI
jgi:hypothetical protein